MASNKNSLNALMFGSDDDSLYLGPQGTNLSQLTGLSTQIPASLTDCGWISEDGFGLELSDSIEKIRGHQGHGVVKTYMSESSTTLSATLLESRLQSLLSYLDATATTTGENEAKVTEINAPASRRVMYFSGVLDLFETTESKSHWRVIFPSLALGERGSIPFKVGELTAYSYKLEVLGGFRIITNTTSLTAQA